MKAGVSASRLHGYLMNKLRSAGILVCSLLVNICCAYAQSTAGSGDCLPSATDKPVLVSTETALENRKLIRQFVLFNYRHLADDLLVGEGMYLDTLYGLYAENVRDKSRFIVFAKSLLLETADIPDFARKLSYCY
jgi:hypothetical protein